MSREYCGIGNKAGRSIVERLLSGIDRSNLHVFVTEYNASVRSVPYMEQTQRTHDELYLREDRSQEPKEYFKFLVELTRNEVGSESSKLSVMDVGCAGGDFLCYFARCFPDTILNGIDVMKSLVSATRSKLPQAHIAVSDINSPHYAAGTRYDLVYMSGVHTIFSTCESWVQNIEEMLKPTGTAFIFGIFNPLPYDVLVQIRKSGDTGKYETGWNSIACKTVESEFIKHNCNIEFIPWTMPLDIPFNESDPLRSWTTKLDSGENLVTNGTRIIHDFYCAVVRPKPVNT